MATKNPRVSVMLKPESDAILSRLSAATKQSKSAIIAEFLEDTCMPMFERMVTVLEAAATATDDAKAAAKQGFADAEQKLLGVVGITNELFDVAARPLVEQQEKAQGKRKLSDEAERPSEAPDGPARSPHVTRGSGTPITPKCICIITEFERVQNDACPVHAPVKRPKRPSKPFLKKVKG